MAESLNWLASKPGGCVHPIGLHEHLLSGHGLYSDGLQVKGRYIGLTPVILDTRSDDDGLAPAIGNAHGLSRGHLYHQLVWACLVTDAGDGNQGGRDRNLGILDIGNGYGGLWRGRKKRLSGHLPVAIQPDIEVDAGELSFLAKNGSTADVLCQAVPIRSLNVGEGSPRFGNLFREVLLASW